MLISPRDAPRGFRFLPSSPIPHPPSRNSFPGLTLVASAFSLEHVAMADTSRTPVIVSAVRTPIGRFLGGLSPLSAPELGAVAIREAVRRARVDLDDIEEVIMGNVIQGGVGQAPARQAALKAGVPNTVSAVTINKVCGSGLKSVMLASQAIKAGDLQVAVAGGQESMS